MLGKLSSVLRDIFHNVTSSCPIYLIFECAYPSKKQKETLHYSDVLIIAQNIALQIYKNIQLIAILLCMGYCVTWEG